MALTPGGLPYPVGTDKVVDGDDAIHALATAVDRRVSRVATFTAPNAIMPADSQVAVGVFTNVPARSSPDAATYFTAGASGVVNLLIPGIYAFAFVWSAEAPTSFRTFVDIVVNLAPVSRFRTSLNSTENVASSNVSPLAVPAATTVVVSAYFGGAARQIQGVELTCTYLGSFT
jgi:hypothetical protein